MREALAGLVPREPSVAFYSALTGGRLESPVLDADYWYRSLREPVAFAAASRCLLADGYRFFVEASPHPALVVPLAETAEQAGAAVAVTGSLRREEGDFGCAVGFRLSREVGDIRRGEQKYRRQSHPSSLRQSDVQSSLGERFRHDLAVRRGQHLPVGTEGE